MSGKGERARASAGIIRPNLAMLKKNAEYIENCTSRNKVTICKEFIIAFLSVCVAVYNVQVC